MRKEQTAFLQPHTTKSLSLPISLTPIILSIPPHPLSLILPTIMPLLALLLAALLPLADAAAQIGGQPYLVTGLCMHEPPALERAGESCNKTVIFGLFDPEPIAPTHTVCEATWPANATSWPTNWMRVSWKQCRKIVG